MKTIQKIMCAVDLSQHSDRVAEYTSCFAKAFNAEVMVVYATPALTQYVGLHMPPSSLDNIIGETLADAEKKMNDFVEKQFSGMNAKGVVLSGYAAEEILAAIEHSKADLVIMGTHGRKGLDRILFGSVAEHIVKNSPIPVMTVRPSPESLTE